MMTPDATIQLAHDYFQSGRLDETEALCRSILAADPNEHRALRLLGGVFFRRREFDEAIEYLRAALRLSPNTVEYLDNLCAALNSAGRSSEAEAAARELLRLVPGYGPAALTLGTALKEQGRLLEAEEAFRLALQSQPKSLHVLNNLANVLRLQGRLKEAEAAAREGLEIHPGIPELWLNLGAALHDQQRHEEAIEAFHQALRHRPDFALAAFNRGVAEEALDRFTDAEGSYRQAIALQPAMLTAFNNLGAVLKSQGRLEEALRCFEQALNQRPDYMVAHTNLLLSLQCLPDVSPEVLLEEHREWSRRHADAFRSEWAFELQPRPDLADPIWDEQDDHESASTEATERAKKEAAESRESSSRPALNRPLRAGFVSPDLGNHPVGRFFVTAFEKLDPARIETFCYSHRRHPDEVTERFRRAASHWLDTRFMNDEELARQIREDGIDVLIDLTGHTGQHRLQVFARRPAPVQAAWIGYAGTTGLTAMDWIIADRHLIPIQHEPFYSERVVRMPHSHLCIEPLAFAPECVDSPYLSNGHITFGSFNKPDKTNRAVLEAWAQILSAVPDSKLVLRNRGLHEPATANRFLEFFRSQGIAAERVELAGWTSHEDLLRCWNDIDIALDTFPFSGGATSVDALWMGVPIVTLAGPMFASRQTFSLLQTIGETSTVAETPGEYVDRAIELASDPSRLNHLRSSLRQRFAKSPLCDAALFALDLTELLEQLTLQSHSPRPGSW